MMRLCADKRNGRIGGIKLTFSLFFSLLVNGLSMGMIYAMIAMGLILLIRAVGVLNFAQGDLLMVGAYIACVMFMDFKLPFYVAMPLALVFYGLIGLIFMMVTYWPLRRASYVVAPIIATMGASLVLSEGTMILFGSWPRTIVPLLSISKGSALTINLFGTRLQAQFLLIIAVAVVVMSLIYLLFERTYIGIMMQAAAQDKPAAELMGISTLMTTAVTYILVTVLVSIGGYMVAPIYTVTTSLSALQLRAFAGTVIGGFGSIKGAIIGCLLVGTVESFATVKFSSYKDAIVFLILIIFLIFRPQGLIVDKVADKA